MAKIVNTFLNLELKKSPKCKLIDIDFKTLLNLELKKSPKCKLIDIKTGQGYHT